MRIKEHTKQQKHEEEVYKKKKKKNNSEEMNFQEAQLRRQKNAYALDVD